MRHFVILFYSMLIAIPCGIAKDMDIEKRGLKGSVKTLKETTNTEFLQGGKVARNIYSVVCSYDEMGRIMEKQELTYSDKDKKYYSPINDLFYISDTVITRTFYEYNSKGRLANAKEFSGSYDSVSATIRYGYVDDFRGEFTIVQRKNLTGPFTDTRPLIFSIRTDDDTVYRQKEITTNYIYVLYDTMRTERDFCKYDMNGKVFERMHEGWNGQRYYWTNFTATYDLNGNIIESKEYLQNGSLWQTIVYSYNNDQLPIEVITHNREVKENRRVYTYESRDRNGNYLEINSEIVSTGPADHKLPIHIDREIVYY